MADTGDPYLSNHRRQQALAAAAAGLALLFAIAPRQERALFIVDGPPIRAFGAGLPPITLAQILQPIYDGADILTPRAFAPLRAFLARGGVPPVGPGAAGPGGVGPGGVGGPAGPNGSPFVAPLGPGAPFGAGPIQLASAPGFGAFPFPGASLSAPSTSPVAPGTPGVPTPGTETPTTPGVVTPAVPEPSAWASMIAGFLVAGAALRRRHSSSRRERLKVTDAS